MVLKDNSPGRPVLDRFLIPMVMEIRFTIFMFLVTIVHYQPCSLSFLETDQFAEMLIIVLITFKSYVSFSNLLKDSIRPNESDGITPRSVCMVTGSRKREKSSSSDNTNVTK